MAGSRSRSNHRAQAARLVLVVAAGLAGLVLAGPARGPVPVHSATPGATLVGLAAGNRLLVFQSSSPGAIQRTLTITGLPQDTVLAAIDYRPANAQLYALGIANTPDNDTGRLYRLSLDTGRATQVGSAPFSTLLADSASYGFDFDPVNDWIRLVNDDDQNLRINPDNGTLRGDDNKLDNEFDTEQIVAAAYDRNFSGATATTLFGLDFANDMLVRQGGINGSPSPAGGALTTIGSLGLQAQPAHVGFDIANADGTAYASLSNLATALYGLYTINLRSGAATFVGLIGNGQTAILGLAVAPVRQIYLPVVGQ